MNLPDLSIVLPVLALAVVAPLGVAAYALQPWWAERRRARWRAQPFPAAWRRILRRRVPLVAHLPVDMQHRLKRHIQVFIAEKSFIGCQGQAITDEVRVTIAAQACLLLLGNARSACYPRLRQILVYPGTFVVAHARTADAGVVQEQRRALAGESWVHGQVILSWDEVLAGAAHSTDGRNVTLHEFAHQVDQDKGVADGRPWRPSAATRRRWDAVMGDAFARLQQEPSALIDGYGATDPAEFFAVVTEVFFERPQELAAEAPAVYAELAGLFNVDPRAW